MINRGGEEQMDQGVLDIDEMSADSCNSRPAESPSFSKVCITSLLTFI